MKKDSIKPYRNEKLEDSLMKMKEESLSVNTTTNEIKREEIETNNDITNLENRLALLFERVGADKSRLSLDSNLEHGSKDINHINESKSTIISNLDSLSDVDLVITCIVGGLGVLVDFLIVKIPKSTHIVRNKERIYQEGSPVTEWIRKIGFDENGKTANWIKNLEKFFKINYDRSIIKGEKGFYPQSHRLYNLGHDPSPSGFLWALKDAIQGTFSYIDKNGNLKIIPSNKMSPWKIMAMPIIWLGHIISDIFTKAGIPIPGFSLLRTLQFGSFGEKGRTIGQVIEYMYLDGFDLRHLVTMSSVNAVIELLLRLYDILIRQEISKFGRPEALYEADRTLQKMKLEKMLLTAYAVASAGNIAKLAIYQWNPNALNLPVWLEMARKSIYMVDFNTSTTKMALDAVKMRATINNNFDNLERRINQI